MQSVDRPFNLLIPSRANRSISHAYDHTPSTKPTSTRTHPHPHATDPKARHAPVSIIPGMEMAAPERTEKSKGLLGLPNSRPVCCSMACTAWATSSTRPKGSSGDESKYCRHVLVVMMKPGGTGRPMLVICWCLFLGVGGVGWD